MRGAGGVTRIGDNEKFLKILVGKREGKNHFEDMDVTHSWS
jgi:hypothetical protein